MPLTKFQSEVLAVIVSNRSEQSHFAGGLVLNASEESARFSNDFDMFHDAIVDLDQHSLRDVAALEAAGYEVEKELIRWRWRKSVPVHSIPSK